MEGIKIRGAVTIFYIFQQFLIIGGGLARCHRAHFTVGIPIFHGFNQFQGRWAGGRMARCHIAPFTDFTIFHQFYQFREGGGHITI